MTEPRDGQPTGDETPQDHTGPTGSGHNDPGPMDQAGFDEL